MFSVARNITVDCDLLDLYLLLFLLRESQNKFMYGGFHGVMSPKSFFSNPIQFMQKPRHTIGRERNEGSINMRCEKIEPYLRA